MAAAGGAGLVADGGAVAGGAGFAVGVLGAGGAGLGVGVLMVLLLGDCLLGANAIAKTLVVSPAGSYSRYWKRRATTARMMC